MGNLLGFKKEIVESIKIYVNGSRCARKKSRPLPSVVFSIEKKVSANNCDTDSYNNKNEKNEQHKSINIVNFVCPK